MQHFFKRFLEVATIIYENIKLMISDDMKYLLSTFFKYPELWIFESSSPLLDEKKKGAQCECP